MQEIRVRLWRNSEAKDWSVDIDGLLHEHISSEILEALVECALVAAEGSLLQAEARPLQ